MTLDKPHLLLDVDDVQRDFTNKAFEIYIRDFDPEFKGSKDDVKVFDLTPYFTKLPYLIVDFFHDYKKELFAEAPPVEENIAEIVSQLQENYFVHVVTHQFKGFEPYTFEWFNRLNIPYDAVSFVRDKAVIKGDLLIDDGAHNLDSFLEVGGSVVCINQPWNESWRKTHSDEPAYKTLSDFLKNYDHDALRERSVSLLVSKSSGIVESLKSIYAPYSSSGPSEKIVGGLKPSKSSIHLGPKMSYDPDSAKRKLKN